MSNKETSRVPVDEDIRAEEEVPPVTLSDTASDEEEEVEDLDPDLADGDNVICRGYPRNKDNLEKYGFRPVWTSRGGYPCDYIPADIKEELDLDGRSCEGASFVGPLRSLAWLTGLDELVKAIESPAYTIEDSIQVCPMSAGWMWPVEWYIDQGLIPWHIADKVWRDWVPSRDLATQPEKSPEGVMENPTPFGLCDITDANRLQRASGKILCMKVNDIWGTEKLGHKITRLAGDFLDSKDLWFRSLSVSALKSALALFVPEANSKNRDNDFGPGFYTADTLSDSLKFLRGGAGAVMVFKDVDRRDCSVWEPRDAEWAAWVARWSSPEQAIHNLPAPPEYAAADFIEGPISAERDQSADPIASGHNQLVAVSHQGCKVLSDSLFMVIFIDPK